MNKLPLTNINKFRLIKYISIEFKFEYQFEEFFYVDGIDENETHHGTYRKYDELEGIIIIWKGNPFKLRHREDNYVILTNELKYEN